MKIILRAILMYPFVLIIDIGTFFYRLIDNIKDCFNKHQFNYDDIVEIEFYDGDLLADTSDSIIFYENDTNKPDNNCASIISLGKNEFDELKRLLKENEILKYKKNIFRFSITPLWYLWCADIGDSEESLIIKFKNGQVRRIDSYCTSKKFDTVVKYLKDIKKDD